MMILGFAALFLGFVLPGHYPPWTSFEQQAVAAVGVGLVSLAALTSKGTRPIRVPLMSWVVLAAASIPCGQWLIGQIIFRSDALLSSLYLVAFALSIAAGATLVANRRGDLFAALGLALIASGTASTGLALLQWFDLHWGIFSVDMPPGGRPSGNLAQPNHLATLLALSVMATLHAYEHRRLAAPVAALAVVWFGLGMVMSQSRTGWLFVALFVVWWAVMRRRAALRLTGPAVLCGAALFVAAALSWGPLNDLMLLSSASTEGRLQAGTRWLHWETLWDALWRSPWMGYGWSQVVLAQQAAILDHTASGEWLLNSHNLLLDLLLWNGIPLGILLFGALVGWFVWQVHHCSSVDQWALLGSVGAVFLHSLFEYPLDYTYFLLPVGLMMGAVDGDDCRFRGVQLPRWVFAAPMAITLSMLVWISAEYLRVQDGARQLRFAMLGNAGDDATLLATVPDVVLLDGPREFHRFLATLARPNMSGEEVEWMRRVSQRQPVPPAMLRYALAAGLNGRMQEARVTLGLLCKMHPKQRCVEGRESWAQLQQQYPQLRGIEMPPHR